MENGSQDKSQGLVGLGCLERSNKNDVGHRLYFRGQSSNFMEDVTLSIFPSMTCPPRTALITQVSALWLDLRLRWLGQSQVTPGNSHLCRGAAVLARVTCSKRGVKTASSLCIEGNPPKQSHLGARVRKPGILLQDN